MQQPVQSGFLSWLKGVRRTPLWFIALVMVVAFGMGAFTNLVVFPTGALQWVHVSTNGWIDGTFLGYVPQIIVVGFLFWKVGKLRWNDFGLTWSRLWWGLGWTAFAWCIIQVTPFIFSSSEIVVRPEWSTHASWMLCDFVEGQLMSNALVEEVIFRAFLITQFAILFHRVLNWNWTVAVFAAVLVSAFIFSIWHIPNRINLGHYETAADVWSDQWFLFKAAVFFALIFILTNNLFIVVGIHALDNSSPDIFTGTNFTVTEILLLAIFITMGVWRWWVRAHWHEHKKQQDPL